MKIEKLNIYHLEYNWEDEGNKLYKKINELIELTNKNNERISDAFTCINSLITILIEKEITTPDKYEN